jgi:4-hydroxy-2,2'-bipyrrole-5-carbaldehyde O-methyltransferase
LLLFSEIVGRGAWLHQFHYDWTHIKRFIRPGGFLLLTTCCQGVSLGVEVLNLWGATTANGGRLPRRQEMADQLDAAGYTKVEVESLVPGDAFYSFKAFVCPEAPSS